MSVTAYESEVDEEQSTNNKTHKLIVRVVPNYKQKIIIKQQIIPQNKTLFKFFKLILLSFVLQQREDIFFIQIIQRKKT